jgi:tRNA-(ms[2]io[6]A)-hydroxylase
VDADSAKLLLDWIQPYEAHAYRHEGKVSDLHPDKGLRKQLTLKKEIPYGQDLLNKMVRLIQEELHHFIQVREQMVARNIPLKSLSAGRYAKTLLSQVRTHEPAAFIDKLILGAIIEARSCERFAKLAPYLDCELSAFYVSLLRSEARHYQDYLTLAQSISTTDISVRVTQLCEYEKTLILNPDNEFRFHSGQPTCQVYACY